MGLVKTLVFIAALALAFAMATPVDQKALVTNMVLAEDHSTLKFDAIGRSWSIALERAAHTAPGEGHYEGVVEGDHGSVAHVNVYPDSLDAVLQADGQYHFVEYDLTNDMYHMYANVSFDPSALSDDMLPALAEPLTLPSVEELKARGEVVEDAATSAKGVASRPSVFRVAAYWDTALPTVVSRDPKGFVRALYSTLNTLVMKPRRLPLFQVTMKGGIRGRGVHTSRDGSHDWFSGYIGARSRDLAGFHIISWSIGVNLGGRAFLGSACTNYYGPKQKTNVSGTCVWSNGWWSRAYTLRTLAHESGHNLGAPHAFGSKSIMDYNWPQGSFADQVGFFSSGDVAKMRNAGCA